MFVILMPFMKKQSQYLELQFQTEKRNMYALNIKDNAERKVKH